MDQWSLLRDCMRSSSFCHAAYGHAAFGHVLLQTRLCAASHRLVCDICCLCPGMQLCKVGLVFRVSVANNVR